MGICGTDYHIFEGKHPFLEYPRVMGHELAVELLEPATGLSAGDVCVVNPYIACGACVACRNGKPNCCVRIAVLGVHRDGGMTGLLTVPAGDLVAAPGLTPEECATVECLAIGAHAVRRGAVAARDRMLVIGAGPIGLGVSAAAYPKPPCSTWLSTHRQPAVDGGMLRLRRARRPLRAGRRGEGANRLFGSDFHRKEMTLLASRNAMAEAFQTVIAGHSGGSNTGRSYRHPPHYLTGAVRDLPRWATGKIGLVKALVELG